MVWESDMDAYRSKAGFPLVVGLLGGEDVEELVLHPVEQVLISSTGTGRIASVSREDLGLAAATVLSTSGHDGAVYELTGPRSWSFDELAQLAVVHTGRPLMHTSISDAEFTAMLTGAGLPDFAVDRIGTRGTAGGRPGTGRRGLGRCRPDDRPGA
jgi:uncharacterized protein YbjT (DUF2867 family)